MNNKLKLKFTSENPFQKEIDMFYWSLAIIKAFDDNELTNDDIKELDKLGFNWGFARQKLIENSNCKITQAMINKIRINKCTHKN